MALRKFCILFKTSRYETKTWNHISSYALNFLHANYSNLKLMFFNSKKEKKCMIHRSLHRLHLRVVHLSVEKSSTLLSRRIESHSYENSLVFNPLLVRICTETSWIVMWGLLYAVLYPRPSWRLVYCSDSSSGRLTVVRDGAGQTTNVHWRLDWEWAERLLESHDWYFDFWMIQIDLGNACFLNERLNESFSNRS